jgi:GTPase SAR1 family protein
MGACTNKSTAVEGFIIRIGLLGDSVCGKSSILKRFTHNNFSLNYQHNTKNLAGIKSYLLEESFVPVTVEVWEVQSVLSVQMDIAVIIADSTMPISDLQDYYWKYLQIAKSYGWNNTYIALSKTDIKDIDDSYGAKVHEALVLNTEQEVFLTSALSGKGIDALFKSIITHRLRAR